MNDWCVSIIISSSLGLDFLTLEKKLSNGYRLGSPKYAPKFIAYHMKQCWNEIPEERPSYDMFLQKLENLYDLKTSLSSKANHDQTCSAYRMRLRYASLVFHEQSLEKQFQTMRSGNTRYANLSVTLR